MHLPKGRSSKFTDSRRPDLEKNAGLHQDRLDLPKGRSSEFPDAERPDPEGDMGLDQVAWICPKGDPVNFQIPNDLF